MNQNRFLLLFIVIGTWVTFNLFYNQRSKYVHHYFLVPVQSVANIDEQLIPVFDLLKNDIFITDPIILSHFLPDQDKDLLIKNKFINQDFFKRTKIKKNKQVINFGIISNDEDGDKIKIFCSQLSKLLSLNCIEFNYFKFLGYDNLSYYQDEDLTLTGFEIEFNQTIVIVQIFYKLKNILWTASPANETSLPVEEIYEPISLIEDKILFKTDDETLIKIKIKIPGDIFGFLSQIESSQLVHCNVTSAKMLEGQKDEKLQIKALQSLLDMKKMSQEIKFPFSLSSGSLLGFFRECAGNSFTDDADYFTPADFAYQDFEDKIKKYVSQSADHLKLKYIFGNFDLGYEMSFMSPKTNFKSDLFFINHNLSELNLSNQSYIVSHVIWQHSYINYYYPLLDKLCSGLFLGHKVNLPCEPLKMIISDYGPDWTTPVSQVNWSYATSSFNHGPKIDWDQNLTQVQIFGN